MYTVNASPQPILLGVQDLSAGQLPVTSEANPSHFPIVPLFTRKGDVDTAINTVGLPAEKIFGSETFDYRGPYATHQTVLYNEAFAPHANICAIKRLLAPGARSAKVRLAFEMVRSENPVYRRADDGSFLYENGAKILEPNYQVSGHRYRWLLLPIPETGVGVFGDGKQQVGTLRPHPSVNSDSVDSVIYPVVDLRVEFGEYGNHVGFSLWSPHPDSENAIDQDMMDEVSNMLYRLKLVERKNVKSSPITTLTADAERTVDFTFAQKAYSDTIKQSLAFKDVYAKYTVEEQGGNPEIPAPFKEVAVYDENIAAITTALAALENDHLGTDLPPSMFNFVSNLNQDGNHYMTTELLGPIDGGIRLDEDTVHYAFGGSDGDMRPETYEQAVRDFFNGFESHPEAYLDDAYWPISMVWDSGFDVETKDVLPRPMGLRKDMGCILATQEASKPLNTASIDSSIGISLRNRLLLLPESTYYGTSTARAAVYEGSFMLADSEWTRPVPLTVDLAKKVARRMGAANGQWKPGTDFSVAPASVVELATRKRFNAPWRPIAARNKNWRNGIGSALTYSRNSMHYPAFPTVHPDKTSILSDLEVALCVIDLEKVCQSTWRAMTNSSLSPEDFIAKSDRFILNEVRDKYDGKFVIKPETYFDAFDEASGYSWKCRINLYANNNRYVGTFTVATRRMEDLNNG